MAQSQIGRPTIADVYHRLGSLEGALNSLRETVVDQMAKNDDRVGKHEARLCAVENKQHWYAGIGAACGVVLGYIGAHFKVPLT